MPKIPESIGSFKILQSLGRGGTSQVYKALHPTLKKEVVLKKLTLRGSGPARERFQREADIMMGFNHAHIVKVYDIFKEGSSWIIVQEYVDGPNLEEVIKEKGGLGKAGSLKVVIQCLKVLVYIHKKGVIHRDIKPSNIFLTSKGKVKLGDFGIASRLEGNQGLTRDGAALGTPDFMAPEQVLNPSSVDGRADLYALSLSWYEAWTGEPYPRKGRLSRGVSFSLTGHLLKKGARKNRLFRFTSALSMLIQIRLFLFPLLLWGKKGFSRPVKKQFPVKIIISLILFPLLLWGLSTFYFGMLKNDQYGRFSLTLPYKADTASWYVNSAKARLYRYEEGRLIREKTLLLFHRWNRNTLVSRSVFLSGGSYSLRLSLSDREEWYSFFMTTERNDILWETLDHPPVPVTIRAFISDIVTGETLPEAEVKLMSEGAVLPLTGPLPVWPGESSQLIISCPGYRDLEQHVEPSLQQRELILRAGLLPLPSKVILKYGYAPENPGWTVPVKVNGLSQYLSWEVTPTWTRPALEGTELILLLAPGKQSLEIFSPKSQEISQIIELDLKSEEVKTIYVE